MKAITLLMCIFITSCTWYTIDNYREDLLGKYYGAGIETIVIDYGPPTTVYPLGSLILVIYENRFTSYVPKTYSANTDYTYTNYAQTTISESGGYNVEYWCKTIFYFRNGRVVDLRFQGNDCYSSRIKFK